MQAGFFTRAKRAFPVLLLFPFRFFYFLIARKKVHIKFFKTDTVYAFENIPVRLQWLVRNAFWVYLEGYGYVTAHRGMKIISAGKDGDRFVLKAKGFGGTMQKETRISVVKMRPARPSVALTPLHSFPLLEKIRSIKVRPLRDAVIKHTAPGLFINEDENETSAKLREVFSVTGKDELKNIMV